MKHIELKKKTIEISKLDNSNKDNHFDLLIAGDYLCYCDGKLICGYITNVGLDTNKYISAINNIRFLDKQTRVNGMSTRNRTIGYLPRNHMRKDYCSLSRMALDNPSEHNILCGLSTDVEKKYIDLFPDTYKQHLEKSHDVIDELHLNNTIFTSGIINKTISLDYHFDKGNFKNVMSGMVTLKQNVTGGYLVLPEYEIAIECADDSIFLFDGQSIIHGVNDIQKIADDGLRYTIVFYSMLTMWECLPFEQELDRVRMLETVHELDKVNAI